MESTTECTWRQNDLQLRSTKWNLLFEFFWIFFSVPMSWTLQVGLTFVGLEWLAGFFLLDLKSIRSGCYLNVQNNVTKLYLFKKCYCLFFDVAIYNARLALRDLLWSGFSFRLWSFSHVRTAEVENARAIKSVRSASAESEPRTF